MSNKLPDKFVNVQLSDLKNIHKTNIQKFKEKEFEIEGVFY